MMTQAQLNLMQLTATQPIMLQLLQSQNPF